jgi:DNA-binding transcriptional MocR family regulator
MMAWAFHDAPADLKPTELVMLLALCDAANDDGDVIYLGENDRSQEALARKTRLSRRTVQRSLQELTERKLLEKIREGILEPYRYRVVASDWRNGALRQADAFGGVTVAQRTSIDGGNGISRKKPAKKKPIPLPASWAPTPTHAALASERGLNLSDEAESFRAHAEANAREVVVWDAAFRQWLLKARPGAVPAAAGVPPRRSHDDWMEFNR